MRATAGDVLDVEPEEEDEPYVEFDCEDCGDHVVGEYDRCPECGVYWGWGDE